MRKRQSQVRGQRPPHPTTKQRGILSGRKTKAHKEVQAHRISQKQGQVRTKPDFQTWLFSDCLRSLSGGQACGTKRVKTDNKLQPVGEEILVSEGVQGFSELPLCTGVLENSAISSVNHH